MIRLKRWWIGSAVGFFWPILFLGAYEFKQNATVSDVVDAIQPSNSQKNAYFGHYGYVLSLPEGYLAIPRFDDAEKTVEVVWFFPSANKAAALQTQKEFNGDWEESRYGELGMVRLEVVPRRHPRFGERIVSLDDLRGGMSYALQKAGETFTVHELNGALPGFQLRITAPGPLVQNVLLGQNVLYVFTSDPSTVVVANLIGSLKELQPHDKENM